MADTSGAPTPAILGIGVAVPEPGKVPPVPPVSPWLKWIKWPPDRKVWAGGLSGIAAWLILQALHYYAHIDPQLIANSIACPLQVASAACESAPDVQLWLAGAIGLAAVTIVPPTVMDTANAMTNKAVAIANALPHNETTAKIVSVEESNAITAAHVMAGDVLPSAVAAKALAAGVLAPPAA